MDRYEVAKIFVLWDVTSFPNRAFDQLCLVISLSPSAELNTNNKKSWSKIRIDVERRILFEGASKCVALFMHYKTIINQRHINRKSQISSDIISGMHNMIDPLDRNISVRKLMGPFHNAQHAEVVPVLTIFPTSHTSYATVLQSCARSLPN